MTVTNIQVTAADNELFLIASTSESSSELLHYKSGYNKPVNVILYPGAILETGTYTLNMIGINWGGTGVYKVIVTDTDGTSKTYEGRNDDRGVSWTKSISMGIQAGS